MIKNYQSIKHDPKNEVYGDCYRACVSSILGVPIDDVPHVFEVNQDPDAGTDKMIEYLNSKGFVLITVCYNDSASLSEVLDWSRQFNQKIPCIFTAQTTTGSNHCYVLLDGEIWHDPSPEPTEIKGVCNDTKCWHLEFLARDILKES